MGAGAVPIAGGVFQAIAGLSEADEKSDELTRMAETEERNALVAREAGRYNAERQQRMATKEIGAIRSDYAASGITSDSLSALEVLRERHTNAELDRQNILYGADMKSVNLANKAKMSRVKASKIRHNKETNAFLTVFGAGAQAAQYD